MTDLIEPYLNELKSNFLKNKTKSSLYRKTQLQQLLKGIIEMQDEMKEACYQDLGRCHFFTEMSELSACQEYCRHFIENLDNFMRDVYFDPSLIFFPNSTKIRYEPLGVALIYGSWNFPYFVTLKPLANAIAAGNCAIIKPSEMSPKSSNIIQKIVQKYLDNDCYRVILGDVNVSIQIGKYPFDLICFTGSTEKGKLVAKVAAENLIPCILELGGKCPMIIDESADIDFAAMKVVAAKFQNAGQACITVDYVLCHESLINKFQERLMFHIKNQYGVDEQSVSKFNPEVGKIITSQYCSRIQQLINESIGKNTKVLLKGEIDKQDDRYISPTVILNPKEDSQLMKEEIFGPVLPIISYQLIDEAINKHILKKGKPLSIYFFGNIFNNQNYKDVLEKTSSGNVTANDILSQTIAIDLGFGGVGGSGMGRYGGYEGFKNWSNQKSIVEKLQLNIWPINYISPPYTENKQKVIRFLLSLMWLKQNLTLYILTFILVAAFAKFVVFPNH